MVLKVECVAPFYSLIQLPPTKIKPCLIKDAYCLTVVYLITFALRFVNNYSLYKQQGDVNTLFYKHYLVMLDG